MCLSTPNHNSEVTLRVKRSSGEGEKLSLDRSGRRRPREPPWTEARPRRPTFTVVETLGSVLLRRDPYTSTSGTSFSLEGPVPPSGPTRWGGQGDVDENTHGHRERNG